MAKWQRQLAEHLKACDVVLMVLDARAPLATCPQGLVDAIAHRPVVWVFTKTDLADPKVTQQWIQSRRYALGFSSTQTSGSQKKELSQAILAAYAPRAKAQQNKGLKPRHARAMVFGVPNVGKSSLINALVGQKKVQTASKAGVTRAPSWVRVHAGIDLLDTPGLFPLDALPEGATEILPMIRSTGEAVIASEPAASWLLKRLQARYAEPFAQWHQLPGEATLETLARTKCWLKTGDLPDTGLAAERLLKLFRDGKLGRYTLQAPGQDGELPTLD